MTNLQRFILASVLAPLAVGAFMKDAPAREDKTNSQKGWTTGQTFHLKGCDVSLSDPVSVAESKDYLCMPTMALLANGDLVVSMCAHKDVCYYPNPGAHCFSTDGGLTWGEPVADVITLA